MSKDTNVDAVNSAKFASSIIIDRNASGQLKRQSG